MKIKLNPNLEEKKTRHIKLSWELLEHKCFYYIINNPIIGDYEYDKLEKEYDQLCNELNLPNSVADMVDFDTTRHSCQLVMRKLGVICVKTKRKKKENNKKLI